jgi:hypothetical protein
MVDNISEELVAFVFKWSVYCYTFLYLCFCLYIFIYLSAYLNVCDCSFDCKIIMTKMCYSSMKAETFVCVLPNIYWNKKLYRMAQLDWGLPFTFCCVYLCSVQTILKIRFCGKYSLFMFASKAVPLHHEGVWRERRYSFYSFMTSALDGGEWSASRPGRALTQGKRPPVPAGQKAGWAPEPVWTQLLFTYAPKFWLGEVQTISKLFQAICKYLPVCC